MIEFEQVSLISLLLITLLITQFLLNWLAPQHRFIFIFNMLLLFQGISIFLLRNKVPEHLGLLLIITSGYYTLNSIRQGGVRSYSGNNVFSNYILNLRRSSQIQKLFPSVGFLIVLIIFLRNWILNDNFGQNDRLLFLSAITWIAYNYIPLDFQKERDFIFIFLNILILTFIVPEIIFDKLIARGDSALASKLIYTLLVSPLENLLNFTGYDVWDHEGPVTNSEGHNLGLLSYRMADGSTSSILITEMCSGVYSIYIFTSAFAAYILTEYKRWDNKINILLLFGFLTAYIANLLRMYLIILVGIYWGGEKLFWAHTNFGWLIFLFWVGLFWQLLIPRLMFSELDPNPK